MCCLLFGKQKQLLEYKMSLLFRGDYMVFDQLCLSLQPEAESPTKNSKLSLEKLNLCGLYICID